MQWPSTLFGLSPQNLLWKSFLYFLQKSFSNFFLKKVFPIFRERYVQNPGISRTRNIFRTLTNSKLEAYSATWYVQNLKHIQNTVKHLWCFAKNSYLVHFLALTIKNSVYFSKQNFLIFPKMELSIFIFSSYFRK